MSAPFDADAFADDMADAIVARMRARFVIIPRQHVAEGGLVVERATAAVRELFDRNENASDEEVALAVLDAVGFENATTPGD